jgi:hypothetical protein
MFIVNETSGLETGNLRHQRAHIDTSKVARSVRTGGIFSEVKRPWREAKLNLMPKLRVRADVRPCSHTLALRAA